MKEAPKKTRKEDTNSEYRELFAENLIKQSENHQLQSDVLKLHKEKMEIAIQMNKVDLEKKQMELETARALAQIEIKKQQRLAELEIAKMEKELQK